MKNWVIVITFTYPHEAHMAKMNLESNGVEVIIRDEMTTQVHNFISNAIGGVKLEVKIEDLDQAIGFLKDAGYLQEQEEAKATFISRFDTYTSGLPVIGKSIVEFRLLIISALILIVLLIPIAILNLPSDYELITRHTWCMDKLSFEGKVYQTNTIAYQGVDRISINMGFLCNETLKFIEDGSLHLPGFSTPAINAKWKMYNDSLVIYNADTSGHVLNGPYSIEVNKKKLKLESASTIIVAYNPFSR
jgi:hypothetical protein